MSTKKEELVAIAREGGYEGDMPGTTAEAIKVAAGYVGGGGSGGGAGMIITATGGDDVLTTDVTYEEAVAYVNEGNYDVVVIHDHSMSGYDNCVYRLGSFGMTYDKSAGSMVTVLEFYLVTITTSMNKTEVAVSLIAMAPSGTTFKGARGTLGS